MITLQQLYDMHDKYASIYWDHSMTEYENLTHIIMHLNKNIGLMANLCEVGQHAEKGDMTLPKFTPALKKRIVANFLIYALHYSKKWGLDLNQCFIEKENNNVKRCLDERNFG